MMAVVELLTLSFILSVTAVAIPVPCVPPGSSYGDNILQKVGKCGFRIPNNTVQPQLRLVCYTVCICIIIYVA